MNATDLEALRAFYAQHRQQLYTYACSITGNREAAEDAIQGVFERLLRRGDPVPGDLRPYIFRSIRNAALDERRSASIRSDSIFENPLAAQSSEARQPDVATKADMEALLERLSSDERESVVLKIYSGLTFHEIAELRGVPLPTVASWYRRGLERLEAFLRGEQR